MTERAGIQICIGYWLMAQLHQSFDPCAQCPVTRQHEDVGQDRDENVALHKEKALC